MSQRLEFILAGAEETLWVTAQEELKDTKESFVSLGEEIS